MDLKKFQRKIYVSPLPFPIKIFLSRVEKFSLKFLSHFASQTSNMFIIVVARCLLRKIKNYSVIYPTRNESATCSLAVVCVQTLAKLRLSRRRKRISCRDTNTEKVNKAMFLVIMKVKELNFVSWKFKVREPISSDSGQILSIPIFLCTNLTTLTIN